MFLLPRLFDSDDDFLQPFKDRPLMTMLTANGV